MAAGIPAAVAALMTACSAAVSFREARCTVGTVPGGSIMTPRSACDSRPQNGPLTLRAVPVVPVTWATVSDAVLWVKQFGKSR